MLKRKTFLKKKASRDISASRNLRLRRLKHRKAKQFQRHALQLSGSRYLKRANIMFALLLFVSQYYILSVLLLNTTECTPRLICFIRK